MLESYLSDSAEYIFGELFFVYGILSTKSILDEYVVGIIKSVILSSGRLRYQIMGKNHRLKNEEANKIEAIVGLMDDLETLVNDLTKSRWLDSQLELGVAEVEEGGTTPESEGKIVNDGGEIIGDLGEILGKEGEGILRKKILKAIKPLLWVTRFTNSRLHEDLKGYEKRKGKPQKGKEWLRDPSEILILYSECCFDILMESGERALRELMEKEAPKQDP